MKNTICPNCDSILPVGTFQCPGCGRRVGRTTQPADSGGYSRLQFLRELSVVGKVILVLAIAAIPTALVIYGYKYFWKQAVESNPYPTEPEAAVTQFFNALQHDMSSGFQDCYSLIHSKHKSQTAVVKSTRSDFSNHFRRIRDYLVEYVGPDFLSRMKFVEGAVAQVTFDDSITLTLELAHVKGIEDEYHYAILDMKEFPFPSPLRDSMGITRRDNQMNDLIDEINNMGHRQSKQEWDILIQYYKNEKQLDVRHNMLLEIIEKFGDQPAVQAFLRYWMQNQEPALHLRRIARRYLETSPPPEP